MADEIEQADHQAAEVLRHFSQELSVVWERYAPWLPTNADLYRLRNSSKKEDQNPTIGGNRKLTIRSIKN